MAIKEGMRVRIKNDGDGAEDSLGTIATIFKSGRCRVDLDCGGFRNLSQSQFEVIE